MSNQLNAFLYTRLESTLSENLAKGLKHINELSQEGALRCNRECLAEIVAQYSLAPPFVRSDFMVADERIGEEIAGQSWRKTGNTNHLFFVPAEGSLDCLEDVDKQTVASDGYPLAFLDKERARVSINLVLKPEDAEGDLKNRLTHRVALLEDFAGAVNKKVREFNSDLVEKLEADLNKRKIALSKALTELEQIGLPRVYNPEHAEMEVRIQALTRELTARMTAASLRNNESSEQVHIERISVPILARAAMPADATRLRLDEEIREIGEKLRQAMFRDSFDFQQRMAVRPADLTQTLLEVRPKIVHFSGHGTPTGAICFEDEAGNALPIQPEALAELFAKFSTQVCCVVLNTCYSEPQANAVAKHIDYVVGMRQATGDRAAIAFAIGFYQALGANLPIPDAYDLGCAQVGLHASPGPFAPILLIKGVSQARNAG